MSSIDQRIVEMQFDNRQFESGVKTTISTLDRLKEKLKFTDSKKSISSLQTVFDNISLRQLASDVTSIANRFTFMGIMGQNAMHRISNAAINTGKKISNALTLEPVISGFKEYETQINAVQTILSNTRADGTTIEQVNDALSTLR